MDASGWPISGNGVMNIHDAVMIWNFFVLLAIYEGGLSVIGTLPTQRNRDAEFW